MKKVLLSVLAIGTLATATFAQKISLDSPKGLKDMGLTNPERLKKNTSHKGEFISDWYDHIDMFSNSNVGSSLQTFVTFIGNDSNFKYVTAEGNINYTSWFGGGGVIDPKDDLIELTANPQNKLSVFNSYRLDSVAFAYLYVRNIDSIADGMGGMNPVVDTLKLFYYSGSKIEKRNIASINLKYSVPTNWDFAKRMPGAAGYTATETHLLSSGVNEALDTTRVSNNNGGFENGWFTKIASFPAPAGIQINASTNGSTTNNLVGFSYHFKSGVPAIDNGDTAVIVYQKDPSTFTGRRSNYMGYRFASVQNGPDLVNATFYNNSLNFPRRGAYVTTNGWAGYVPGSAYFDEIFQQTFYHLTVVGNIAAGLTENEGNIKMEGLHPNPAKNNTLVRFGIKNSANTSIQVVNMIGQTVITENFGKVNAGNHEYVLNLNGLNNGVYFVNVTSGNTTKTERLVVAN